jgi:hypothetical protein
VHQLGLAVPVEQRKSYGFRIRPLINTIKQTHANQNNKSGRRRI